MAFKTTATGERVRIAEGAGEEKERLRQQVEAQRQATNIRAAGGSARVERVGGKTFVVQVKAPELFTKTGEKARPDPKTGVVQGFSKADLVKMNALEAQRQKAIKDFRDKQRLEEAKQRSLIIGGQLEKLARERREKELEALLKKEAPIPQQLRVLQEQIKKAKTPVSIQVGKEIATIKAGKVKLTPGLEKKVDLDTVNKLRSKGVRLDIAIKRGEEVQNKKNLAIKKVQLTNEKIDKFNKNYNTTINKILSKAGLGGSSFGKRVARQSIIKISKFLNPIIVGTEIGATLSNFKTLREAGIVSVPRSLGKAGRNVAGGITLLVTNPKRFNQKAEENLEKILDSIKRNLDPKTVEGASNLITLSYFLRPDKIVAKNTKKILSKVLSKPKFKIMLKTAALSPLTVLGAGGISKGAIARKTARVVRKAKKAPSKVELRKRSFAQKAGVLTRQQKINIVVTPAQQSRLAKAREVENLLARTKPQKTPTLGQITKRKRPKFTAREKKAINNLAKLEQKGITLGAIRTGNIPQLKKASRNIQKSNKAIPREIRSNNLLLVTKTKKSIKIKGKKSQTRTITKLREVKIRTPTQRYYKTSDIVSKDLRPEKVFPDLIQPATQTTRKGWRNQTLFNQVTERIKSEQAALKRAEETLRRTALRTIDKQVLSFQKDYINKVQIRKDFLKLLNNPSKTKFKDLSKYLIRKDLKKDIDNTLRIISLIKIKIKALDKLSFDVRKIPISKPRKVTEQKVKTKKRKRKIAKRKVLERRRAKKVIIKKPVSRAKPIKRVVRKAKKPVKIVRPRRRIPRRITPFLFRKGTKLRRIVEKTRSKIKSKFRPSLLAIVKELKAFKEPDKITGIGIRRVIVKLAKDKEKEEKKKNAKKVRKMRKKS